MPEIDETEPEPIELRRLDMHGLWRVLLWGSTAAMALAVVAGTAFSDLGTERIKQVVASLIEPTETKVAATPAATPAPAVAPQQLAELEKQTRELTQLVRDLTADRDRVKERLATLQQSVDDITGTVKRQAATQPATQTTTQTAQASQPATTTQKLTLEAAPPAAKEQPKQAAAATPPPAVSVPQTVAAVPSPQLPATTATAEPPTATASTPPVIEASPPIDGPIPLPPSRTAALESEHAAVKQIGIEIGGAPSIEALRAHWSSVKANIGPDIVGLSPTYTIRQKPAGGTEYRLVLGPVPNSAAAIRLCAKLATNRITCRAGTFNVQKLAGQYAPAPEQRAVERLPAMSRDAIISR